MEYDDNLKHKKMVSYLDRAGDQKVKAIYTLLKDGAEAEFEKGDVVTIEELKKLMRQW